MKVISDRTAQNFASSKARDRSKESVEGKREAIQTNQRFALD